MNHTSTNSPADTEWSGRKSEKQNNGVSDDFLYDNILCDNPDEIKSEEVCYVQDEESQDCLYDDILSYNLSVVKKPSVSLSVPYKYNNPSIVSSIASNLSVLPTSSTTSSSLPVVTSVETNYSDSKLLISIEALTARNKVLERNFLSLVQTCRREIKSKNQQIKDLTRELEEILFRRAGPLLTKNDFEKILRRTRPPCDFSCLGAPPRINEETSKLGSKTSKVISNENLSNESKKKSNESVRGSRNTEIKSRLGWRKDISSKDINGKKNNVREESSSKLDVIQLTADSNRYLRKKTGMPLVLSELSESLSCNVKDVRKLEPEPQDKLSSGDSVKQLSNPASMLDNDLTPEPTSNSIEEPGLKLSVKSSKHHNIREKSLGLNQVIETKSLIPSNISNSTQPTGNKFSSDHVVKMSAQIARQNPEQNQQMSRIEENGGSKTFPSDDQLDGKESHEALSIVREPANFPRLEAAKAACLSKDKPCQNATKKYNKDEMKKHNNLGSSVSASAENRINSLTVIDIFQIENLQSPQNMIKSRLKNSATVVQEVQASSTAKSGVEIPKEKLDSTPESNKTKKKAVQKLSVIRNPEKGVMESFMDKDSPSGNSKPEIGSPTNKSSQSFENATWKCLLCCLGFRTRKELRDHRREYDCCKKERSGTKKSSEIKYEDRSVSDSMSQSSSPLQLKCSGEETRLILKPKDNQENSRPKSELIDLHQKNLTELEDGLMIKSSNSGVKHVAHTEETLPCPDLPKNAEQEIIDEELRKAIRSITPAEDTEDDLLLVHLDEDEAIFGSDEEAEVKIGISEKDVVAKNVSTSRVINPVQKKLLSLATSSQTPTVNVSKDFKIPRKTAKPERSPRTPDQENRTPKDYLKPNAGQRDSSCEKIKKRRKSISPKIRDKTRSRGRSRSPRNRSTRTRGLQSRGRSQTRKNEEPSSKGKCTPRNKKRSRRDSSQRPSNKRSKLERRSQSLSPSRLEEDSVSLATLEETRNNLLRILHDDIEDGEIMDSDQECPLIVRENDKVAEENKKTNSLTSESCGPRLKKKKKIKERSSDVVEKYRGDKERLFPKPPIKPIIQPDKEIKKSGPATKHGNTANDSGSDKENSKIKKSQTVHSSHVEDSLRITRESLLVYTDEDINHRIIPFKQKQLMELSAEERSLKDMIRSRSRSKSRTPSRKNSNSLDESKPTVSPLKLCLRSLKDGDIREPSSSSESLQECAKELDLAQLETSVMGSLVEESDNAVFDNISSYREKSKKLVSNSEIISGGNTDSAMNREAPIKQVLNDLALSESETDSPIKSNTKSLFSPTSLTSPSLEINHPVTPRCLPASLNPIDTTSAESISDILRSPLYSFKNKPSDLPSLKNVEQPMERKIDKIDLKRAKKTRKRLSVGGSSSVISVVSAPSSSSNKIGRESKTYESTILENRVQIANGIFESNVKDTCEPKATICENTSSKYLHEADSSSKNIQATPQEEVNASELKNKANPIIPSPILSSISRDNQESSSTQELKQKFDASDRQMKKKKRSKLSFSLTTPEVLFVHSE